MLYQGDQASIVGGAINYVKELEQQLQSLEVQKKLKHKSVDKKKIVSPFAEFFTFPQYTSSLGGTSSCSDSGSSNNSYSGASYSPNIHNATVVDSQPGLADVEVTMVESHVNLKMVTRRRPKQLVKIVACLQKMQLIPQHLNMTSADERVMYSFSLKVCTFAALLATLISGITFVGNILNCNSNKRIIAVLFFEQLIIIKRHFFIRTHILNMTIY